jgi:hypothetical protein
MMQPDHVNDEREGEGRRGREKERERERDLATGMNIVCLRRCLRRNPDATHGLMDASSSA